MPEIVPMPKLGFDMAEGKLVRRVKKEGEVVQKGDILAEIETDKATVEVESSVSGVVKGWLVEEGQPVPVGASMAVIGAPDEVVDLNVYRAQPFSAAPVAAPAAAAVPPSASTAPASVPATQPSVTREAATPSAAAPTSPIARRIADEIGRAHV